MPSQRRHTPNAAALPASRLPLGTPQAVLNRSPPTVRAVSSTGQCSTASFVQESSSDKENQDIAEMSRPSSTENQTAMSLAEAKLARQNRRNQQAEAALHAPVPLERERQTSRGKGKAWKPLDYTSDAIPTAHPAEGGGVEVRVNRFHAATRESSLSRSMSTASTQRTSSTLPPSERGRHDSSTAEPGGFQLYTGRRSRRAMEQLNAYEDKPETKQTTVEAAPDTREIYEVFGNALPSLDFMTQNPGVKNGQLQFVQHPNGDVAAHQWSSEHYQWDNIGQFSNIRKKVEGQLGADRLKGETADQTLLKNTLRYFRAIAKQREAAVTGTSFGAKEIQAILPDVRPTPPPPATAKKPAPVIEQPASSEPPIIQTKPEAPTSTVTQPQEQYQLQQSYPYDHYAGYGASSDYNFAHNYAMSTAASAYGSGGAHYYSHPFRPPVAPRADRERYNNNFFQGNLATSLQDPFYTENTYRNIYNGLSSGFGGQRRSQQSTQPQMQRTASPALTSYPEKVPSLNYDYHFPPPGASSRPVRPSSSRDPEQNQQQSQPRSSLSAAASAFSHYGLETVRNVPERQYFERNSYPLIRTTATETLRPKPVTPLSSRAAMRDGLMKLSDQAKERSLSQTNIRTVLYDPFRSQIEGKNESVAGGEPAKQEQHLELKRTVANPSGLPQDYNRSATQQSGARDSQSTVTAPRFILDSPSETYSSPQAQTLTQQTSSTPYADRADPENLKDLLLGSTPADTEPGPKMQEPSQSTQQSRDAELRDWWFNGTTFARHEDLYNSIKAANADTSSAYTTSSPASQAPIGTPAKKPASSAGTTKDFDKSDALTRALIPVWENLASYTQGPAEKRRDYFSPWTQAPEWAIDRSDNTSFFDKPGTWGQPPARVGRDPRYRAVPMESPRRGGERERWPVESVRFGGFSSPTATVGSGLAVGAGLERRFAYGRM